MNEYILNNGKYKLTVDNLNVTTKKNNGKFVKDKETKLYIDEILWDTICYSSTIQGAFKFIVNDMLKDGFTGNKLPDLKSIIAMIENCTNKLINEVKRLEPITIIEKVVQKPESGLGEVSE